MKKICIVHYNTPYALTCLIKSINLHVNDCHIYVFENSDKDKFNNIFDNVEIFDNSKGEIIDYDEILKKYPNKECGKRNNWASFKHCLAIDKCFDLINDNFILMDSDILIKKDFSSLYQEDKLCVGSYEKYKQRIAPYICFINVNSCKKHNIRYYNDNYMHGLGISENDYIYDTGYYFTKQISKDYITDININDYIIHYKGGSWEDTSRKIPFTLNEWVDNFKQYWEKSEEERYIITLTSWPKRIHNIPIVLNDILEQTILPHKICLNLSIEEFPKKEESLPESVIQYINKNKNIIEIHWLVHNTKTWKKIIPTLYRYPNDCIICIDDDVHYPKDFIETFVKMHEKMPNSPLSGVNYKICQENIQHCGTGSLDKLSFIQTQLETITKEVFNEGSTDTFYTYCYKMNNSKMQYVGKIFHTNLKSISNNDPYSLTHHISVKKTWSVCNMIPLNNDGRQIIEYICQDEYTCPITIEGLTVKTNTIKYIDDPLLQDYPTIIEERKVIYKPKGRTIYRPEKKNEDDTLISSIYDNF